MTPSWPTRATEELSRRNDGSSRIASAAFVGSEVVAFVFYLIQARALWFFGVFGDEWDFLAGRRLNPHDLLQPHGDHFVALPALVFRLMYTVFGLRSYLPYQLISIGLHLGVAALLRRIMLRSGVRPWIATAAATLFVFFGAGSENILIAFQITFTGALVLGLTQLLLADHDAPLDRRDVIGLVAGVGGLMCSDVALVMIGAVGIAGVLARRWRSVAFHILPLAALFVAWSMTYGRHVNTEFNFSAFERAVRTSVTSTFAALGQLPFVGWILAIVLVVGTTLAWRQASRTERSQRLAAAIGLMAGAIAFVSIIALSRGILGRSAVASSRYLYVIAALFLPALAVSSEALVRRWRALAPVVVALLLVGIPGNIAKTSGNVHPAFSLGAKRLVTVLPRMTLASQVPGSLHPTLDVASEVTVKWLLDGVKSGRIPETDPPTPIELANNTLRLSLEQVGGSPLFSCKPIRAPMLRRLRDGQSITIAGTIRVQLLANAEHVASGWLRFGRTLLTSAPTYRLRAVSGPLIIRVQTQASTAALC